MHSARLELRSYRRPFRQPLKTYHGLWSLREGIVLKLTDDEGRVGWGEIAPIVEFGTESMGQAIQFCRSLPQITPELIEQIPGEFPACQFGLESAWETLTTNGAIAHDFTQCHLLPSGANAMLTWQPLWQAGARTFKWKIGVAPLNEELNLLENLFGALPAGAQLRLDANGGLSWEAACEWLQVCDRYPVEFLEQPLPPDQLSEMLQLRDRYTTPIALDESVTTLDQLEFCHQQGWRGIFVIKAAIAGSPTRLRQICQECQLDVVWSSAFETAIARQYILNTLIPSLPLSERAIGFGVKSWFANSVLDQPEFEEIWRSLEPVSARG
ncbi:MAG: o-succinylbenzoate synthase [Drouetiella hepatica Uher 2000/2452]|jgi:O-succinylbenzoate synthase|uniref:o-succinylbenzoate synthase n=1 Tax=Drouetiella hepatica Uher 2000/2452 TaxID=904376 RepID=A0A951Q7F1_9CYAN|nr:o-succinylbenzoate synthase [Drouetiella hepatica Uher 2000/2452]